jgi:hypothetical protein
MKAKSKHNKGKSLESQQSEKQSLRDFMQSLTELEDFQKDPVGTIIKDLQSKLSDDDLMRLETLNDDEKETLVKTINTIVDGSLTPEQLSEFYRKQAQGYEAYFGWEGMQEKEIRSWCP